MYQRILLICTGNTCRSAMAAPLLQKMLQEELGDNWSGGVILSAGLAAFSGAPASKEAREVMSEEGIDLSAHQARILTRQEIDEADLVIVMTLAHKEAVLREYPSAGKKVFALGEFTTDGADVSDPFGQGVEVYRQCAAQIKEGLTGMVNWIKSMNREGDQVIPETKE